MKKILSTLILTVLFFVSSVRADMTGYVSIPGSGGTLLPIKYAVIAAASSGDNALVAAVTAKKIRVLCYNYTASGTVNVKFRSGTDDISGLGYHVANNDKTVPCSPIGAFETASGAALNVNLSGAVAIGGGLSYVEVP